MIKPSDIPEFINSGNLDNKLEFADDFLPILVQPETANDLHDLAEQMVEAGMSNEYSSKPDAVRYAIEVGIAALRAAGLLD